MNPRCLNHEETEKNVLLSILVLIYFWTDTGHLSFTWYLIN